MDELLEKLKPNQRTGSKPRCHRITHGERPQVAARLTRLIEPWGSVSQDDPWMPDGFECVDEAELHKAEFKLPYDPRAELKKWWFAVPSRNAKSPNFDIASRCTVRIGNEQRQGMLLVEAKAHTYELEKAQCRKALEKDTPNSRQNHEHIDRCIQEANRKLHEGTNQLWSLSRDSCYQISNRFAWAWKLIDLKVPVILVYLGFLRADEMGKGKSRHFDNHEDWVQQVRNHSEGRVAPAIWEKKWTVNNQAFIPLLRSVEIPYKMPCTSFEVYRRR